MNYILILNCYQMGIHYYNSSVWRVCWYENEGKAYASAIRARQCHCL